MPWSLEIHHIFLSGAGDSTLIVARHPAVGANLAIERTVLIDGGRWGDAIRIQNYLAAQNVNRVDVIAVTHFDEDHYYGIVRLLKMAAPTRYDNALIYDCGQLRVDRLSILSEDQYGRDFYKPSRYREYRAACIAPATRTHVTRTVASNHIAQYDAAGVPQLPPLAAGALPPDWLLGRDIMWGNGAVPPAAWAENPPGWAPGAPTLRCVVANKWVQQAGAAAPLFISELNIFDGPNRMPGADIAAAENAKTQDNAKSLGFVLEFNNFRYYVAGDLERAQEDGHNTINAVPPVFYPGVRAFLNPAGTAAGRVLAMKTSHHGAATASSREFLTALRPSGAFISNSARNKFGHPFRQTINALGGYPEILPTATFMNTPGIAPPPPPPPPWPPIQNYLTGYQVIGAAPVTLGGAASLTAGPPGGPVRLNVSEAQSQRDQRGQVYRGVSAALTQVSATAALGMTAAQIDTIANLAVTRGAATAAGQVVGATSAMCDRGTVEALLGADTRPAAGAPLVPGLVSAGVAAAGGAAGAAVAIGAVGPGRAAGAVPGTTAVLSEVVTAAPIANIIAAGLLAAPGNANGVNAAAQAATAVSGTLANVTASGYAAMAALGAVAVGATIGQGAVIGAVVGAQAGGATAVQAVTIVRAVALATGVAAGNALAAALVAGVTWHGGAPADVQAATLTALTAHGIPPGAAGLAAAAAQAAATVADARLFAVSLTMVGAPQNIDHIG
jgi:hypothetical protein